MPIYDYLCSACGQSFDAIQKFSDAPLTDCRKCAAAGTVTKKLTAPGFALKGSGWYVTDFRGGNTGGKDAKKDGEGGKSASDAPAPAASAASDSAAAPAAASPAAATPAAASPPAAGST